MMFKVKLIRLLFLLLILLPILTQAQLLTPKETFTRADTLRGMLTPLRTCYDINYYHLDVRFDIDKKFTKLLAFYKEGLNKVGWNNYSRINIAFENEVVCTRKDGVAPLEPVMKTDSIKLPAVDEPPISDMEDSVEVEPVMEKPVLTEAVKPVKKPAPTVKTKAKTHKEKIVKREKKAAAPAKQQPKAVYKPGNKSVNTSKKQKTP